jgi:hypothetical protein
MRSAKRLRRSRVKELRSDGDAVPRRTDCTSGPVRPDGIDGVVPLEPAGRERLASLELESRSFGLHAFGRAGEGPIRDDRPPDDLE